MGVLDVPALSRAAADARYGPRFAGSGKIKTMVDAAAMASPPTLAAQTAQFAGYTTFVSPSSSIFRYSGAPIVNISGSYYFRNARNLSDTVGSWSGCGAIEFDLCSSDLVWKQQVPASAQFKLWVDEQPHAIAPTTASAVSGVSGTGSNYFKAAFGTRKWRRIRLELASLTSSPASFGGLYTSATDLLAPPSIASPKLMVIGDSYAFGVGPSWAGNAYPIWLARLLGFAHVINFTGVPSTGPLATANNYGNYSTRFAADVVPLAPDVLLYQGSVNDGGQAGAGVVGPQVAADLAALRAALPNTRIIALSPLYVAAPSASLPTLTADCAAGAATAGVPFVDVATKGYFTGTGSTGATNGSGNSDFMAYNIGGLHPSDEGSVALARLLAPQVAALVGEAA